MSPLVWDLGHIAAYEDLWLAHRHAGLELLRGELADLYDAFETPRAVRGEIEALGAPEARAYLGEVRARSVEAIADRADAPGAGGGGHGAPGPPGGGLLPGGGARALRRGDRRPRRRRRGHVRD